MIRTCLVYAAAAFFAALPSAADSASASCSLTPNGSMAATVMHPCTFSQYQGNIYIVFEDNSATFEFHPDGDSPGTFLDAEGKRVYRKSGAGQDGQRFVSEAWELNIYWTR